MVCPDGPLLVRGPASIRDAAGQPVEHDRNVIALCRCGRSGLKPLCDGSHRSSRFRDRATAAEMAVTLRTAGARRSPAADAEVHQPS
ncbi:MAG: CDGSH iron-sulfur domain-containing protein [Propionibacteriaceae bacterium]